MPGTLRENAPRARDRTEQRFDARADGFDLRDVRAGDLKPDRRPHACGQHVNPSLDRHGPGVRQSRDFERGV